MNTDSWQLDGVLAVYHPPSHAGLKIESGQIHAVALAKSFYHDCSHCSVVLILSQQCMYLSLLN